jgi:hypothetical protein
MKKLKRFYLIVIIFSLLQKNLNSDEIIEKLKQKEKEKNDFNRIRCPHCKWQPKASSLWFCSDCDFPEYFYKSCGTAWNTFNTHGKCPGCQHQWRWTSCLSCSQWSLHEDWYEKQKD